MTERLRNWLKDTNQLAFAFWAISAAFITYFSMYAFRKPFSAGTYEDLTIWAIDYKVIALITQVCGYALSKFIGIKVISEMKAASRVKAILVLIGLAWGALFLFGITPQPYNVVFLFFNGLPLGMIWGVVFSFLEGRRYTELLGAGLCASFIVSSGVVKSIGRALVYYLGVSEFWMPFLTGLIFVIPLLVGVFMLGAIPGQTDSDEVQRNKREPMAREDRRHFFLTFALGICLTVLIYMLLTIFRDIRDNFTVEIWQALGYGDTPHILATAEIPVAVGVLIIIGLMSYVRHNRPAFFLNFYIIIATGLLLAGTTYLFEAGGMGPIAWMILNGFAMYLAYIAYHTFLFERWIALFRHKSNIGFLMYIADAFGYVGSITVMLIKNFGHVELSWLTVLINLAYLTGLTTVVLGVVCIFYFKRKQKVLPVNPY
jgi:hypothetical protein